MPRARISAGGGTATVPRASSNAPRFSMVNLRVHEIRCVKTTKEIDRDEIILSAIKTEGKVVGSGNRKKLAAKAEKGKLLDAGKFKKGDVRRYRRPRVLASFKAGSSRSGWPRYYYATLLMIEKDEGAIGTVVNAAVKAVEKEAKAAVTTASSAVATAAMAGLAAGSSVPLVGTAIGAAAGAAVGMAASAIKKSRQDDVFPPKAIHLRLPKFPRKAGLVASSKKTVVLKGFKGTYRVTYSWAVR